jgi:hypothetical protein
LTPPQRKPAVNVSYLLIFHIKSIFGKYRRGMNCCIHAFSSDYVVLQAFYQLFPTLSAVWFTVDHTSFCKRPSGGSSVLELKKHDL